MSGPRTFTAAYKRDLRPDCVGQDWRVYTYGPGHWCVGEGHSGTFRTQAEARLAGELWVETGLPPIEQTAARIAERRAANLPTRKAEAA